MKYLLRGATVYTQGGFQKADILVSDGIIVSVEDSLEADGAEVLDLTGKYIFPGFVDVHVHLREPGFLMKETIATGTAAAARGGYTAVCAMPNLDPVPDCRENIEKEIAAIEKSAKIRVYPYASITRGEKGKELADMRGTAPCAVAFSDDGKGVQDEGMMLSAMRCAKECGRLIAAHCEDEELLRGGYIHDGEYAAAHGHRGICSESEWKQVERDIRLAEETGCSYHVCHVSTKESVELIRAAKKRGADVTCETCPHYLVLNDGMLQEDGSWKMNPPIRGEEDRKALVGGLLDGTVDMIVTDHAPHTAEEKSRGLEGSLMGVVGLETAFPILYTKLVKSGQVPLELLINKMTEAPAARFGLNSGIRKGAAADLTAFDLAERYEIDPQEFLSKGRSTPFKGETVFGKCRLTMVGGIIAWMEK